MATSRRSALKGIVASILLAGCRYELDTTHPAPQVALDAVSALIEAPRDPAGVTAGLAPLVGADVTDAVVRDWLALVEGHPTVSTGQRHVVISHQITSSNINIDSDGQAIGRLRVVTRDDGTVLRLDVLREWLT